MCGILGLLTPNPSLNELVQLSDLLRHRGPDDGHVYVGDRVGLAARRLSIIDLADGRQPLSNEDGTIWICYNGEVYNAPELRQQLLTAGHHFRSRSDTEVIVHAYEEWGEKMIGRLRGMFAFALWDGKERRLLLARDRFGMKPLYYAQNGQRFAFASEIQPLFCALPQLVRQANLESLWRLFEIGFIPAPLTAFQNVYQLPAAHYIVVENGRLQPPQPYWHLNYPAHIPAADIHQTAEQFLFQLRQAVNAWRLSDVPVGSLLSGGIDSSALAALLNEISGPIHTFNIAFTAASHDEAARARQTAVHLNPRVRGDYHHELIFNEEAFNYLPAVVRHLEAPQTAMTTIPLYLLYKACREAGFKVILTGEGADELLGGYHWFDGDRRIRPLLSIPQPIRQQLAHLPLPISADGRRVLAHATHQPIARYTLWHQITTEEQRHQLLKTSAFPPVHEQWARQYAAQINGRHPLNQFLHLEAHTRLPDFINFEVDRMSMAHSIEARPPFLDHQLWEFCAALPPDHKLIPHLNKRLLRLGMAGLLPEQIRQWPKQGLAAPHSQWWRQEKLPAWAENCLHRTALQETGYFDTVTVARLRTEHQAGKRDHGRLLTGILTTQLWHQELAVISIQ
jgi:asparagine synthase (glutamine-hydrolysing)